MRQLSRRFFLTSLAAGAVVPMLDLLQSAWTGKAAAQESRQESHPESQLVTSLTSQEQASLRQGQVLLSGKDGSYTARVMARGSIDTAWAVLTDYNNFANFFPSVESSQLLSSDQNEKVFEQVNVVRIFPITRRARVVIAASETYPSNIFFRLVEGDLEGLQGSWYVTGAGSQVMITHQVVVDPGSSDRALFFTIYKDNLKKTMAALKQEIERRAG